MRKYLALIKGGFLEGIAYKENFLTRFAGKFCTGCSLLLCMEKYFFISYGD